MAGDVAAAGQSASTRTPAGRFGIAAEWLRDPRLVAAVLTPLIGAAVSFWLFLPTVMPGVGSWDTAEFQTVGPLLGTAHPTGYASYVVLGWVASIVLQPFGDPAYRMNLLQAIIAAVAVAGTVGIVQALTGLRFVAVATGLLLAWSQLFWQFSTHADPDMLHLALVALIFAMLLVWERRRHFGDDADASRGDRWLIAAAVAYGVAWTNHSLVLLLAPAIGLFLLSVEPRILVRGRIVGVCAGAFALTTIGFYLELPIRAAMHAPMVYGRPDTPFGFLSVISGAQFGGALVDPFGDLGTKTAEVIGKLSGWLGPFAYVAAAGLIVAIVRRPRYALLSGLSVVATCWFVASYDTADKERYYLVPLMVAYTWVAIAAAELATFRGWSVVEAGAAGMVGAVAARWRSATTAGQAVAAGASDGAAPAEASPEEVSPEDLWGRHEARGHVSSDEIWRRRAIRAPLLALLLLVPMVGVVPERQFPPSPQHPDGVSQANQTSDATWLRGILAPPERGGLPADSVVVSWWSVSTTLWYGQRVEGLRPDVFVVDDRTRLDQKLGQVPDVIRMYLGSRPVFVDRLGFGPDGMEALSQTFAMTAFKLPDGSTIEQVIKPKESQ
ncbi:MAG TPA: DUF2723 domain-containing protein [Candidatus Limnocylindrales bacterium]